MRFLPGVTPADFATLAGPTTALSPNNDGATDSCKLATEGVTGTADPTDTIPAGNVGVTGTSCPGMATSEPLTGFNCDTAVTNR